MSLANKPISPREITITLEGAYENGKPGAPYLKQVKNPGMTLLEHFAGLAMQAIITKTSGQDTTAGKAGVPLIAKYSVEYAKALIAELEKEGV